MTTNQLFGRGLFKEHFCKTFCQNICSKMAYFHFFHYTSIEILSCHSDDSILAMAMQNTFFVEVNIMYMTVKYLWRNDFFTYFFLTIFGWHGNQFNSKAWKKFIYLVENFSRNISIKLFSQYLQGDRKKNNFHFFQYNSMEILKENNFKVANMTISWKFQDHSLYGFWGEDFWIFFFFFFLLI